MLACLFDTMIAKFMLAGTAGGTQAPFLCRVLIGSGEWAGDAGKRKGAVER